MVKTNNPSGAGKVGPRTRCERVDLDAMKAVSGIITAIEAQKHDPKRRSLFIDGEFVIGLHEETIFLERLKVGLEVTGVRLVEAFARDEGKRAWDDALRLLAIRAHAAKEVERRLAKRYPMLIVGAVLERLTRGGWLDDADFARQYIRSHRDYGERRFLQELHRKGVDRTVALTAVQELLGTVDAVSQAQAVAAGRLGRMGTVDRDTAQRRLVGFLDRRGYNFETISQALGPLLQDLPRPVRSWGGRTRSYRSEEGEP